MAAVLVDHERIRGAPGLAAAGWLDLHDFGAEMRKQLRRVGQRLHLLGREHPNAREWLARCAALRVANFSDAHRASESARL